MSLIKTVRRHNSGRQVHIQEIVVTVQETEFQNHCFTCPACERENVYGDFFSITGCKFCQAAKTEPEKIY